MAETAKDRMDMDQMEKRLEEGFATLVRAFDDLKSELRDLQRQVHIVIAQHAGMTATYLTTSAAHVMNETLLARIESLERWRSWINGAVAPTSFIIGAGGALLAVLVQHWLSK